MLSIQQVAYAHPNRDVLFSNIQFTVASHQKVALIGNNGAGKSTLLRIMAGSLLPSEGKVITEAAPYYMPQVYGQFNHLSIGAALKIASKLQALHAILGGDVSELNLHALNEDWTIEERAREALQIWGLPEISFDQSLATLSGGQKTKVFLAGITIHQPEIILLDEPSNHLDLQARQQLYELVRTNRSTMVVVSHDRALLNLLENVFELNKKGITQYGGNYDFFLEQKEIEVNALAQDVKSKEKALRKAKDLERESAERQQKLDARGKRKQEKEGLPTIAMRLYKDTAEKSTARVRSAHEEKTGNISQELNELRKALPDKDKMKIGFDHSGLHNGKVLVTARNVNLHFGKGPLWPEPLSFQINSGERVAISGANGSGKTSVLKMVLGQLAPSSGSIVRTMNKTLYIDQDYSLINNHLSVYEQVLLFNRSALQEHEVKIRLTRFLFTQEYWDKSCSMLSGGEKMRLMLCCLTISGEAPDMIVLDEPTNNLDLQNIGILTSAVNEYQGTLLVVSHDVHFLHEVHIERELAL